jgi:hypothetical protein
VVLALVSLAWTLRDSTRAPLAALLFFIGTLFPVLGFVNVFPFLYSFVADHFQYTASIGLIAGLCGGIVTYLNRATPVLRRVGQAACLVALTALLALTWQRAALFKDSITLYRATVRQNPRCWMCYNISALLLPNPVKIGQRSNYTKRRCAFYPAIVSPRTILTCAGPGWIAVGGGEALQTGAGHVA